MFGSKKYIESLIDAENNNAQSTQNVADAITANTIAKREIAEKEISSKNRVDIELSMYEEMKKENEKLKRENRLLREYFEGMTKGLKEEEKEAILCLLLGGNEYKNTPRKVFDIRSGKHYIGLFTEFELNEFELERFERRVGMWR